MPQLKTNTVTVTNGSNSVVGSGTAWLTGPNPVTVGAYLIISDENGGSPTVYEVQTIPSDTSITLTTNWAGVTGTYNAVIHIDFLPNGVPQLTSGDLETVAVINRAHKILGDDIATGTAAATTTTRGTVEKATSAEAIAGTADNKFPDVKGVKAHIDGRVTSSPTDTEVGKLLKVGDGGLLSTKGLALPNNDADALVIGGDFATPSTWTGSPYLGTDARNQGGLEHINSFVGGSTYAIQKFTRTQGANSFFRYKNNNVWSPWVENLHTSNTGTAVTKDVTTSATDTTAGRLLKVGDFGVGESVRLGDAEDLNNVVKTGFYRLNNNHTNAPADLGGGSYGQMVVIKGLDTITQLLSAYTGPHMYFRSGNPPESGGSGVWQPWAKLWNSLNDGSGSGLDADMVDGIHANDLGRQWFVGSTASVGKWFKLCNFQGGQNDRLSILLTSSGQLGYGANTDITSGTGILSLTIGNNGSADNLNAQFVHDSSGLCTITDVRAVGSAFSWDVWLKIEAFSQIRAAAFGRMDTLIPKSNEYQDTDPGGYAKPIYKSYHQGNLLGTVSQSGGVPTGAVIERGSNVNGEYVKFADGTMICMHKAIISTACIATSGSVIAYHGSVGWVYPSAFASVYFASGEGRRSGYTTFTSSAATATTSAVFYHQSNLSFTEDVAYSFFAIGRWY